MLQNPLPPLNRRTTAGIAAAFLVLAILGGLVLRSAGGGAPVRGTLVVRLVTGTPHPSATVARKVLPAPTATPRPTPTQAPQQQAQNPTPTPPPTPTPSPTPQPTWHTLGSYSGDDTQGNIATITGITGPLRVIWTCTPDTGAPANEQIGFGFANADNGNGIQGQGTACTTGSGTFDFPTVYQYATNVTFSVGDGCGGTGCPPMTETWTATIQEYS